MIEYIWMKKGKPFKNTFDFNGEIISKEFWDNGVERVNIEIEDKKRMGRKRYIRETFNKGAKRMCLDNEPSSMNIFMDSSGKVMSGTFKWESDSGVVNDRVMGASTPYIVRLFPENQIFGMDFEEDGSGYWDIDLKNDPMVIDGEKVYNLKLKHYRRSDKFYIEATLDDGEYVDVYLTPEQQTKTFLEFIYEKEKEMLECLEYYSDKYAIPTIQALKRHSNT